MLCKALHQLFTMAGNGAMLEAEGVVWFSLSQYILPSFWVAISCFTSCVCNLRQVFELPLLCTVFGWLIISFKVKKIFQPQLRDVIYISRCGFSK